jgi:serine/threonine protein kinase
LPELVGGSEKVSLTAGTKLGPYEILSALGAGGMGEVYGAKDTRLDRVVAIKVLPEHRSSSPQVRERFEREARAISSLSHPFICALYDIGCQHRNKTTAFPPVKMTAVEGNAGEFRTALLRPRRTGSAFFY